MSCFKSPFSLKVLTPTSPNLPLSAQKNRLGNRLVSYFNNAIVLDDDDLTDDPAMEADSHVHGCAATCRGLKYDYLCILPPQWGLVLVRMSPRIFLYLSLTDSATGTLW